MLITPQQGQKKLLPMSTDDRGAWFINGGSPSPLIPPGASCTLESDIQGAAMAFTDLLVGPVGPDDVRQWREPRRVKAHRREGHFTWILIKQWDTK